MNGLIKENIVLRVDVPDFAEFCNNLKHSGFVVRTRHTSLTKGYVSRVRGKEPLLIGWSNKLHLWYYLGVNYKSTSYCYRTYFTIQDDFTSDYYNGSDSEDVNAIRIFGNY